MGRLRVKRYGTRAEVMNGTARMTQGRLTKDDFTYNEYGYIVSKKKSKLMKTMDNPLRKKGLLQRRGSKRFGPSKKKEQVRNNFSGPKRKVSKKNKNKKKKKQNKK